MSKSQKPLVKKRTALINNISHHANFIKGSLTRISRKGKLTNGYHLTSKDENQKTVTKYIPKKQLVQVQEGIKNMKKIREIIEKISRINLEILKRG